MFNFKSPNYPWLPIVLGLAILLTLCGCFTQPDSARRILESDGVTNIEILGYQLTGCSQDDSSHTGFRDVKNGKAVTGVVCGPAWELPWSKGYTIRYY